MRPVGLIIAAVAVLLGSPLIGLCCDVWYSNVLTNIGWVRATFGVEFNFLYRVFSIFTIGSGLIVLLSTWLNKQYPVSIDLSRAELGIPFGSIRKPIVQAALIHAPIIALVLNHIISPQIAALPAALLTFLLFIYYWNKTDKETPVYKSDIFYAGLLTASMVAFMYFFA